MTMKRSGFLRVVMAVVLLLAVNINAMADDLRLGGSIVGKIESNGDIRKNGSIIGRAERMTDVRRVAVMYFFPFFNLK